MENTCASEDNAQNQDYVRTDRTDDERHNQVCSPEDDRQNQVFCKDLKVHRKAESDPKVVFTFNDFKKIQIRIKLVKVFFSDFEFRAKNPPRQDRDQRL